MKEVKGEGERPNYVKIRCYNCNSTQVYTTKRNGKKRICKTCGYEEDLEK